MRDIVIFLALIGAAPVSFFMPYVGILTWAFISYMNPQRLAFGFAADIPYAAIVGGATLIGLFVSREDTHFPRTPLTIVWIVFTAWMSFTTLFAIYPDLAFAKWVLVMKIMLMSFVTLLVMAKRERLNQLIWVIVLSLGFYGGKGGVFTLVRDTGGLTLVWGPENSFIADNNALALALVMALPLMYYLQTTVTRKFIKYGMLALMALTVMGIVGTHSRGGFLALAAGLLVVLLKSRYKARALIVAAITAVGLVTVAPPAWMERMENIENYEQDSSAMSRINSWWTAYNLANDRLLGGGFDTFNEEVFVRYAPNPSKVFNAHSIYFEVLGEHGYVGLILFLVLGLLALRTATWIVRHTQERDDLKWARTLASMTQISLIGYAVAGAFQNRAYFDLYYHIVGILILTRVIVERSLAENVGESPAFGDNFDLANGFGEGRARNFTFEKQHEEPPKWRE